MTFLCLIFALLFVICHSMEDNNHGTPPKRKRSVELNGTSTKRKRSCEMIENAENQINLEKIYSEECAVCYDRYAISLKAHCGHEYCVECMKGILGEVKKAKCPLCRAPLSSIVKDFEIKNYDVPPEATLDILQNSFRYICAFKDKQIMEKWVEEYGVKFTSEELCFASYFGKFENLKYILGEQNEVDVNKLNGHNGHALGYAVEAGHFEIVNYLVTKANANVKKRRTSLQTPFWIAAANGRYEILKFLFNNGALDHINEPNMKGHSPLLASIQNENKNVIEFLIQNGADVNQADLDGRTPLWAASSFGQLEIIKYLIKNGANTKESQYINVATPFLMSCSKDHTKVIKFWLEEQAANVNQFFINKNTGEKSTCLSLAVKNNNSEMVKYLEEKIADGDRKLLALNQDYIK